MIQSKTNKLVAQIAFLALLLFGLLPLGATPVRAASFSSDREFNSSASYQVGTVSKRGAYSATALLARHKTLVLVSLTCYEPEDATWDEPELVVSTGGGRTSFKLSSMTRGSVEPSVGTIGQVLMNGQTSIVLYDRDNGRNDWFDADDLLGRHVIGEVATNGIQTLIFNRDGAYYTLRYRVDP